MGAKPGTNNGGTGGKPGRSGRKSAYQEDKMAKMLKDAFFSGIDKKELMKKLSENKIKLFDLTLAKAIKNDSILMTLFHKLYPDKIESKNEHIFPRIKIVKPPKPKKKK